MRSVRMAHEGRGGRLVESRPGSLRAQWEPLLGESGSLGHERTQ